MGKRHATLDFSYSEALPVLPYQAKTIHLYIVGLGGNGGFLARHAACLVTILQSSGKQVTLTFIDPDKVERANIPRQNFCAAEIGHYKAETLARRYAQAFGIEIGFIPEAFDQGMVADDWKALTIVVGCVDRASGRVAMGQVLARNRQFPLPATLPRIWYLDLGNGRDVGQIVLGSTERLEDLRHAFSASALGCCSLLPSPLLQQPKLAEPEPEELAQPVLSCAELLAANAQSLLINPLMADVAAGYLYEFLVLGGLKRFATFIDMPSGSMRSRYTTAKQLAAALACRPAFFRPAPVPGAKRNS